jgi:hypothetical protein
VKTLKQLDPESFELLQEQAALQLAIIESKTPVSSASDSAQPANDYAAMCEEEALQNAIYESTHAATPPISEKSVAMAPKQEVRKDWLPISALQHVSLPTNIVCLFFMVSPNVVFVGMRIIVIERNGKRP